MFDNKDFENYITMTLNKLGSGSFGKVYLCYDKETGKEMAIKLEKKNKHNTLYREFKTSMIVHNVKKYIMSKDNLMLEHPTIKIYEWITKNNLLNIPNVLSMEKLFKNQNIIPQPFTYYTNDEEYNYLTMELCGDNFENIIKKYTLTEECKYYIAFNLLHIISCFHRCGIIHRDIKLANIVLNKKISSVNNFNELKLILIDLGLAKEYYSLDGDKVVNVKTKQNKSITGTIRYLSLNVHEYYSPSIVDDLIGICYVLIHIFTYDINGYGLPWIGHKKDNKKFERKKHSHKNCQCGYHSNLANNCLKGNNTIAEIKYHTDLDTLCHNYTFLKKWLNYLYSLKINQLPSYNILFTLLFEETKDMKNLKFNFDKK